MASENIRKITFNSTYPVTFYPPLYMYPIPSSTSSKESPPGCIRDPPVVVEVVAVVAIEAAVVLAVIVFSPDAPPWLLRLLEDSLESIKY